MKESVLHELPGGWVWTRMEDIITRISNGITERQTKDNTGLMVTRIETISKGTIDLSRVGYLKDLSSEEIEKYKLLPGDILFSNINSDLHLGKTAIFLSNSLTLIHGMNLLLIRPNEDLICPKILHYLCNHYRFSGSFISIAQHAVNQSSINQLKLRNFSLPLPPLPEQQAIVSKIEQLFSDLDNGINNFRKAQAQLKLYRQSVLKAACEGKLVPTEAELAHAEGRDYEAADVLLARILKERHEKWNGKGKYKKPEAPDTNVLSPLPKGWCWVRLDSLAALKGGITKDQNRKVADARKIPYLRVANVQRGYLDLSEIKEIEAQEAVISELLLKPGDILFNEGGDRDKLGRGCIWNGEIKECIYQNHIFRARIYSTDISNKIISWFGNTFGQRYFMKEGKQTTNLASINLTKLSAFPVPLPPLSEQRRIVAEVERRLSVCDKMETTISESLQKAEALRQSILKKAFEGKLLNKRELEKARNASDWEPAEKLLERIWQEKARTGEKKRIR